MNIKIHKHFWEMNYANLFGRYLSHLMPNGTDPETDSRLTSSHGKFDYQASLT